MPLINRMKHLLPILRATREEVQAITDNATDYYEELLLVDPKKPDKQRIVVNVTGQMRKFQERLQRSLFLPCLKPSHHSHGGVRCRSIKTNAAAHRESSFLFKTDISNFYPSVHHTRVYRFFTSKMGCSPDVARALTRICTYRHHLALGLITSPIIADQILRDVDNRIAAACKQNNLIYTRYVDDVSISALFDLRKSNFAELIESILSEHGFSTNPAKRLFGSLTDLSITAVRQVRGHLDVEQDYLDELYRQLQDAANLARNDKFEGPYYTFNQIRGRVRYIYWVNPGRRRELIKRLHSLRWSLAAKHAKERGYVQSKKTLRRINEPATVPSSQSELVATARGCPFEA